MKKRLLSIWSLFLILFLPFFFSPNSVQGQVDNNQVAYSCTITINDTQAVTSSNGNEPPADQIPLASSIGGSPLANFPVYVTLSDQAKQIWQNCTSSPPRIQLASVTGSFNSWEDHLLIGDGTTYSTNIQVLDNFSKDYVVALDVELAGSGVPETCIALQPICRRAYVRLDAKTVENYEQSCSTGQSSFATAFRTLSLTGANIGPDTQEEISSSYMVGTPISLTINKQTIALVANSCSGDYARAEIYNVDTGQVVASGNVGAANADLSINYANTQVGDFRLVVYFTSDSLTRCDLNQNSCMSFRLTKDFCTYAAGDESCTPIQTGEDTSINVEAFQLCKQISSVDSKQACNDCLAKDGVWTAIGCVPQDPAQAIGVLVSIGLNIAGGVALIMILAAGFMMTTSQGEPKRLGDAKDLMQSAVIGLLFIIFSVTILQFIGSDLLKIPGFGSN